MDTFTSNIELVNVGQGIDLYNTHEGMKFVSRK